MKGSMDMAVQTGSSITSGRWMMVAVLAAAVLFGSYAFAQAQGAGAAGASGDIVSTTVASANTGAPVAGGGGGCCGSGAAAPTSAQSPKVAEMVGGVQTISVDVSKGYYDPSVIELKAGVPTEITFSQASGCTGYVQSADLGFSEDLTSGPKTVKLPGLSAGTYSFECGMSMVFGSIVVK
jgi:hypothetical protein